MKKTNVFNPLIVLSLISICLFMLSCSKDKNEDPPVEIGELVLDTIPSVYLNLHNNLMCKTPDGNLAQVIVNTTENENKLFIVNTNLEKKLEKKLAIPCYTIDGITCDQNNGFILGGFDMDSSGIYNFLLYKLTASGDVVWGKEVFSLNDPHYSSICQTPDNSTLVATSTIYDVLRLFKIDQNGNLDWEKTFEIDNAPPFDIRYIYNPSINEIILVGNGYILKMDLDGNQKWLVKTLNNAVLYGSCLASDGSVIGTGAVRNPNNQIYLLKVDKDGNKSFEKIINLQAENQAFCIAENPGEGFIIGGSEGEDNTSSHLFVLKTDYSGNQTGLSELEKADCYYGIPGFASFPNGYILCSLADPYSNIHKIYLKKGPI